MPAIDRVTFNVIYTRGYVRPLLPFALSLLQAPDIRVRLVGNGCADEEMRLIRSVAAKEERLDHYELPYARPAEHGVALNHLFRSFPEPHFAFMDSDVIATGDFMRSLGPLREGEAAAFTAPPVWMTEAELDVPSSTRVLNAVRRRLPDGTYVGNTYCALYDRAALEPAWRASPVGFGSHRGGQVPRELREWISAREWDFRWLDTGRVINLELLRAGYELEQRAVPELHHAGGFSLRAYRGSRGGLRRAAAIIRSSPDVGRFRRLADGAATRLRARRLRDRARPRGRRWGRRDVVLSYLDQVIEAARAGEAVPPPPSTGSDEVDRRVADLAAAVKAHYPRGLAVLDETTPQAAGRT